MRTAEKQRLRERMKIISAERSLLLPLPFGAEAAFTKNILKLDAWKTSSSVLLFAPIEWEPDPMEIISTVPECSFLFPRIVGDHLEIHRMSPRSLWISGSYGIREPDPGSWDRASLSEVDLALIPGLAFDSKGGRLGRGKGFYDRLLGHPEFRGIKAGLAWDWQIVAEVPCDIDDIPMDFVVTPGKILQAGSTLDKLGERG
jgi:5-formyltetrahydrofolate cyclo-ligase